MQDEEQYVAYWKKLAEQKLGWGNSLGWSEYDFEKLSEAIFERTNNRLSVSTLKRILGKVQYNSSPSTATLNVLANFLDFADWRALRQHAAVSLQSVGVSPGIEKTISVNNTRKAILSRRFLLAAMAMLIITTLVMLAFRIKGNKIPVNMNMQAKFESRKVSDNLPNSVVFTYDAAAFHSDSVYIQQSWDPARLEKVPANGKQYTSIYYWPGYFNAKLLVDGVVKKQSTVFIKTRGWIGIIDKKPIPTYLNADDIHQPGAMGVSAQTFISKTGSDIFNDAWMFLYNIREYDSLDGGRFNFETVIRNTSLPEQSSCRKVYVYVIGTVNVLMIPLAEKGCIAALDIFAGDHWIRGKENDLSAFGCDFSNFQKLACSVDNGEMNISLNNQRILTTPIKQPIGRIVGLCIKSEGSVEVKSIKLGNQEKLSYSEDFTKSF